MIDDSAEMEAWVAKKIDLAGDYVKKVHGYMQGEKAGLYDDGGLTEDAPFDGMGLVRMALMRKFITAKEWHGLKDKWKDAVEELEQKYDDWPEDQGFGSSDHAYAIKELMELVGYEFDDQDTSGRFVVSKMPPELEKMGIKNARMKDAVTTEDAGEGHMSKSTLYHTAKYAIELMDMINKGDDLEGWVQSKLNKAADYLQGVHNYEEYQKLNPYREELDSNTLSKHAQVIQKNIDEILARETSLDDVDTKPGMMKILAKRVNEVEKEMAKENRKETNESTIKPYVSMSRSKATGKTTYNVLDRNGKTIFSSIDQDEAQDFLRINYDKLKAGEMQVASGGVDTVDIDEGVKDWAKKLAAAGVIVGAVAGMGSINNAIDNSVPAVKAMNTAYEMAIDAGNTELANMIKKDLSAVKIRLDSGKDLNFVKDMQNKYSKFMPTEGLAYESKLAIMLNQRIK